eukprot:s1336_g9.t1
MISFGESCRGIDGAAGAGRESVAKQWLRQLRQDGLSPDTVTYTSLIKACSKFGDLPGAVGWLHEMVANQLTPDVMAYTAVIHCSAKKGNVEEATRWFERMSANDVRGDHVTYTALINACAKRSDAFGAMKWLQRIVDNQLQPNVVAFSAALKAAANQAESHPRDLDFAHHDPPAANRPGPAHHDPPSDLDWDRISSVASEPAPSPGPQPGRAFKSYDEVASGLTGAPPAAFDFCNRLSGTDASVKERVQRAWEAGLWAKAVLAGHIPKPRPTQQISFRPQIYVILRAPGLAEPTAVSSAADYYKILPRFTSDSLSHSFPSVGEAKTYCLAAGVSFPALLR